ncbi:hypothetical protein NKJ10_00135 [Mesorhizobium sp. M0204]|uniref:hypothetical protein n=1 Tax=Mesorhizobium sp. M0204 TaxID=2956913 RepID=UPI0033389E20
MKKLTVVTTALVLGAVLIPSTTAYAVDIEPDAIISDQFADARGLAEAGANLVRLHGWKCDSVSGLVPFITSRGFYLTCNYNSYRYEIEDRGGNWEVKLE